MHCCLCAAQIEEEMMATVAHRLRDEYMLLVLILISTFTFMMVQIPSCQCAHGSADSDSVSVHIHGHRPFAAKASLLRFWRRVLPNARLPPLLLEKASPLNATSVGVFAGYIANHTLSDHIASFCTAADLLCTRRIAVNGVKYGVHSKEDADFESYHGKEFKGYKVAASDSFKNYSDGDNVVKDDFKGYGRDVNAGSQDFANYAPQTNVEEEGFTTYGSGGSAGNTDFSSYGSNSNVPDHHFKNYGTDSNAAIQDFSSYADNSNVIKNDFATYGKDANGILTGFTSYAENSNVITNSFKGYSEGGNGPLDRFTSYADNGNVPRNEFESYGANGNGALQTFTTYADGANVPQDVFKSYGKGANTPLLTFTNYGNSSNTQQDEFKQYGKASNTPDITFTSYARNTQFKEYDKNGTGMTFSSYTASNSSTASNSNSSAIIRQVEPGKFFREKLLVQGSSLPLPNLKDYMPRRSFLPRSLADKLLPSFSSQRLGEVVRMFRIPENSSMVGMMAKTLKECERPAVKGEIKKCVTSIEGMAEFAVGILGGPKVEVLSTASTAGSGERVKVGEIGGRVTRSVSCHQSMFPYLVYYCHLVPKVKVYQAALYSHDSHKINDGVAICHLDTTEWSAGHAAFVALGHQPGQIEVCHWIFQNDLIWVPLP